MKKLPLLLFILPAIVFAQEGKKYSAVTDELIEKIVAAVPAGKSLRVVIIPFSTTKESDKKGGSFGVYLDKTIIESLSDQGDKIKIFEREQVYAILKEKKLPFYNFFDPATVKATGKYAPFDAMIAGKYTKTGSYVDLEARLIDAASGTITVNFTGRIKMTKKLEDIFDTPFAPVKEETKVETSVAAAPPPKSKEQICKEARDEFTTRARDLSTPEKIEGLAADAMKFPFDKKCWDMHYQLMNAFPAKGIDHAGYRAFVVQSLDTIALPGADSRAKSMVTFLTYNHTLDDAEWAVCLRVLSKIGAPQSPENTTASAVVNAVIAAPALKTPRAKTDARIAEYMALAAAGKVGKPNTISPETAFFNTYYGLTNRQTLIPGVYSTYTPTLKFNDEEKAKLYSVLYNMYKSPDLEKAEMMKLIIDFFNTNEYANTSTQLYGFAKEFELAKTGEYAAQTLKDFPQDKFQMLVQGCSEKFSKYTLEENLNNRARIERERFCMVNNIPVPRGIPTLDEANVILKGNDVTAQLRTTTFLAEMGDRPKKLEMSLVGLFAKKSTDKADELAGAQLKAIEILGNTRTSIPKAIDHMIQLLPQESYEAMVAERALVKIGRPAAAQLYTARDKAPEAERSRLTSILERLGN